MSPFFPAICIDNFFNDPDGVVDFAKSIEYPKSQKNYPGVRSAPLHQINRDIFDSVCKKLFGMFYGPTIPDEIHWNVEMSFQRVDPFPNQELYYPDGWVHEDGKQLAGVIYLNKNDINAGTSLFVPKNTQQIAPKNNNVKEAFYEGLVTDPQVYNRAVEESNGDYEETVSFKSRFNRLVAYDGRHLHAAKNLMRLSEPRYTIVFFVHALYAPYFPAQAVRVGG
jgi:hypothetical protein